VYGGSICGLYLREGTRTPFNLHKQVHPVSAMTALTDTSNKIALWNYMCGLTRAVTMPINFNVDAGLSILTRSSEIPKSICKSLHALSAAGDVFDSIQVPTISLEAISKPLGKTRWSRHAGSIPEDHVPLGASRRDSANGMAFLTQRKLYPAVPEKFTREQAFACVVYLDTGRIDLNLYDLTKILAVSSDNSLYVAGRVLLDPADVVPLYDIRRLTGSIGHAGVSLLIAPTNSLIRGLRHNHRMVEHAPYDFKREDKFKNTSMHLSFTSWRSPLNIESDRRIDKEVHLVESRIELREDGVWVADLNILGIEDEDLSTIKADHPCPGHDGNALEVDYTSIDCWEELLDGPISVGILRAHGNWAARLAAVSILCQQGKGNAVGLLDRKGFCLKCLETSVQAPREEFHRYESGLPSFCID
jgi:hypothetical protein